MMVVDVSGCTDDNESYVVWEVGVLKLRNQMWCGELMN
jgi:hypothetical protein